MSPLAGRIGRVEWLQLERCGEAEEGKKEM